ncbi:MAG: dihydropteroate synthase [Elusimicrobia bacterium]|nr:dihydropteroate synthase [Elusimicrobiota bacterium]MDE2425085.1 dihydropteroate synthase [Elusimicrobiota bacterium]
MGVVNCTPDSFFASSRTPAAEEAVARALRLAEEGADWLDVGGQSTRPGSEAVPAEEELRRVLPVIEALARRTKLPISVDTDKALVAASARGAGASILNDVSALRGDPAMLREATRFDRVILMHMQGTPRTMQREPSYDDVVAEVADFLSRRLEAFSSAGGDASRALVDPGIGFGKTLEHNLSLLKRLEDFAALAPVVLGVSRKSFLSRIVPDAGPQDRLPGSLAAAVLGALHGAAVLRVHDVAATRQALEVCAALEAAS